MPTKAIIRQYIIYISTGGRSDRAGLQQHENPEHDADNSDSDFHVSSSFDVVMMMVAPAGSMAEPWPLVSLSGGSVKPGWLEWSRPSSAGIRLRQSHRKRAGQRDVQAVRGRGCPTPCSSVGGPLWPAAHHHRPASNRSGSENVTVSTLEAFANVLGVRVSALFRDVDPNEDVPAKLKAGRKPKTLN